MNLEKIDQFLCEGNLTNAEKTLYRTGYNFVMQHGNGNIEEAHQYGLQQIAKIQKLRNLAKSGKILKF